MITGWCHLVIATKAGVLVPQYCIISCGGAPLSVLKQYIEQQVARARFTPTLALRAEGGALRAKSGS